VGGRQEKWGEQF